MDFKTVLLKTVNENTTNSGKCYGMWILQYFVDGKHTSVKVVCGEKKVKENGEIWYNAKGMTPTDFDKLKPVYNEFLAFSKNPPPIPGPAPDAAQDDLEEVPF